MEANKKAPTTQVAGDSVAAGAKKKRKNAASPAKKPLQSESLKENNDSHTVKKFAALEHASVGELRTEWRRAFGTDPPSLSRDLLARAIAHRIQERAFGGLSRAHVRRLEEMSNRSDEEAQPPEPVEALRSGARLVREWHGRAHVVTVTDAGFDYIGASYKSLTRIAKVITGAHWSGPRFFGLKSRKPAQEIAHG